MFEMKKRYALLAAGMSMIGAASATAIPHLQRGALRNGVEVLVAERQSASEVHVQLLFDGGNAADLGRKPGTAGFAFKVMMSGMKPSRGYGVCSLDSCTAGIRADDAASMPLDSFAGAVRHPQFLPEDIERVRGRRLAFAAKYRTDPVDTVWRLMYPKLYGADHAYALADGRGTPESLASIGAEDLTAFQSAYVRPDNVKILVAGNTTLAQVLPQLDAAFGDWTSDDTATTKSGVPPVAVPATPRIFLVHSDGAEESVIMGGVLAPPGRSTELWIANNAFAESRLWSHGASSFVQASRGQSPLLVHASAASENTADLVSAIHSEAVAAVGARPLSDDEIAAARLRQVNVLAEPGDTETDLHQMAHLVELGLPDDYWQTFGSAAAQVNRSTAETALSTALRPDALTWVIVGDLSKIEAPIRALNIGEVTVVDYDGTAVVR